MNIIDENFVEKEKKANTKLPKIILAIIMFVITLT